MYQLLAGDSAKWGASPAGVLSAPGALQAE